jgi:NTP pyrophosphatase (non-canonical NTP hydrolase)
MDLADAGARAARVRGLYHQLEERLEGSAWSARDDMLGLTNDVGALARLVMASEGRWKPEGEVPELLADKLAECLWWILVLGERLDIDLDAAFAARMDEIEAHLRESIESP